MPSNDVIAPDFGVTEEVISTDKSEKDDLIVSNCSTSCSYQCSTCRQVFWSSGNLKRHTQIHTGAAPYRCTLCSKSFTQLVNLRKHYLAHSQEKPFECLFCERKFSSASNAAVHQRTHQKVANRVRHFHCTVDNCGKSFLYNASLMVHARRHREERPFPCEVCGRRFTLAGDLRNHARVHSGQRPYNCTQCAATFSRVSSWKRHERKVHAKN